MLFNAVCLLLLPGILLRSSVLRVSAAPVTYDQRQSGDFNVDAKLENFLIIVATSGSGGLFNNLATQVLDLNELITQRSKPTQETPSETMVYETEDANSGKEPYHVEIVHIDKDDGSATNKQFDESDIPEIKIQEVSMKSVIPSRNAENPEKMLEEAPNTNIPTDDKKSTKKVRSLWNNERHDRIGSSMKENKKPMERRNSHVKNLNQPDDLPVKEEAMKAARPGTSLKKQLSKKEEKNASEERNDLSNNYQELVLLGGGIENCGPGRYRDKSGVCQNDKNFN